MKRFLALALLYLAALVPAQAGVPCSLPFTLTNGTLADATQVMANYNALVACLGNAAAAGANNDITALNGLTTPITPGQGGTNVYIGGTSTGSANAQVVATTTPNSFTLAAGQRVVFLPGFTNTGATTLNVRSTGAIAVTRLTPNGVIPLVGGELVSGQITEALYDGTEFVLAPIPGQSGGFGPVTAIASAATTDLGTVSSHNIQITGNNTITAFGASANVALPIYRIGFAGSLTLTNNNTSLALPSQANIITSQNDSALALYLGSGNWQIIAYQRSNGAAVIGSTPLCGALGLTITNNAGTPNTNIDYAADSVVLTSGGNVPFFANTVAGTINTTNGTVTPTADGMDGENRPAGAWGYIWFISDGAVVRGLVSTTLAPSLPATFVYKCRVGAMPFDGSQNLLRMFQAGAINQYKLTAATNTAQTFLVASGTTGTYSATSPTLAATQVTGNTKCGPVTATDVNLVITGSWKNIAGAGQAELAPNVAWGGTNNGPSGTNGNIYPLVADQSQPGPASSAFTATGWIHLESNSVGYASIGASTALGCIAYKDKVNAN
jgi:hypothetical protein